MKRVILTLALMVPLAASALCLNYDSGVETYRIYFNHVDGPARCDITYSCVSGYVIGGQSSCRFGSSYTVPINSGLLKRNNGTITGFVGTDFGQFNILNSLEQGRTGGKGGWTGILELWEKSTFTGARVYEDDNS